jgi:hypothetical protein
VFVIQAPDQVRAHWQQVTEMLRKQFPAAVPVMEAARDDGLAFLHFPQEHWRKIWSTNPLERLNNWFKRRTNVLGRGLELTNADPPPSQTNPSAERHQRLPQSPQNSSIAESPIQRSGFHSRWTELGSQLPSSHLLTAPVPTPERGTGPPELHRSEGRYQQITCWKQHHKAQQVCYGRASIQGICSGAEPVRSA